MVGQWVQGHRRGRRSSFPRKNKLHLAFPRAGEAGKTGPSRRFVSENTKGKSLPLAKNFLL